jgi:hypothetical protein
VAAEVVRLVGPDGLEVVESIYPFLFLLNRR